jgi:hypothetical protein
MPSNIQSGPPENQRVDLTAPEQLNPLELAGYWDEPLTPKQAGEFIKRSKNALAVMRCREDGPAYSKCGRSIRYTRRDCLAWLERHRHVPLNAP